MKYVSASALALGLMIGANGASAADLGGNCCADLEERIAELEATTARKGNRKVTLTVSGQVNEALLYWDDGIESNVYVATNETSRTRFRFVGEAKITGDWTAGYLLELGVRSNRMSRLNQDIDDAPDTGVPDIRHSTWFIGSKTYGKAWVGQTSQATDGITEITTANTSHFARNSITKWNTDWFLNVDGARNTGGLTWRQILPQSGFTGDSVPGEGDRFNLVRYDSPAFHGFSFQAAWGEDDFWDAALRYAGEIEGFKLAGGIGYSQWSDASGTNGRGCAVVGTEPDLDCSTLGMSASVMHLKTGLFLSGSYGFKDDENRDEVFGRDVDDRDEFFFVQGGIEQKFIPLGKTTFYGEYGQFDTGAGINGGSSTAVGGGIRSVAGLGVAGNVQMANSEVDFWGIGVNQHLEAAAMDIYLAYRHLEGEVDTVTAAGANSVTVDLDAVDMVMGGAMIKF